MYLLSAILSRSGETKRISREKRNRNCGLGTKENVSEIPLSDDMSIVRACVHVCMYVCMRASAAHQTKTQYTGSRLQQALQFIEMCLL